MKIDIKQLEFIDRNLRNLLVWVEKKVGVEFIITSLYRVNDFGVHGTLPLRGTDLRMRNSKIGLVVKDLINTHWLYDPERPKKKCAILHGVDSNLHLHIQVHRNTKKQ